jgi:hypothetical protein
MVAPMRDQCRRPELLDQHHRTSIAVEQQHGNGIAAREYQPPLVAAHAAVIALVADDQLIDLEEIVEQALLRANFHAPGDTHVSSSVSCGDGDGKRGKWIRQ